MTTPPGSTFFWGLVAYLEVIFVKYIFKAIHLSCSNQVNKHPNLDKHLLDLIDGHYVDFKELTGFSPSVGTAQLLYEGFSLLQREM